MDVGESTKTGNQLSLVAYNDLNTALFSLDAPNWAETAVAFLIPLAMLLRAHVHCRKSV